MGSSSDKIFGITTTLVTIPSGATNAVLVAAGPAVQYTQLKYVSGGSICVFGNPQLNAGTTSGIGTTFSTLGITQLVTGFSNAYPVAGTEILQFNGPCQFYISTLGNTSIVALMQELSTSMPSFN